MPITLYYVKLSPPVRAVLLTAKALDLTLNLKLLNILKGEHLTPEFIKMNPLHTVPVLDDNGFVLFDSHAINAYLVRKYGKTDALYPKDFQARAVVDQRLHFDSGVLFARLREIVFPMFVSGETTMPEVKQDAVRESYESFDLLLGDSQWVAGDKMTIADFCCVATITSLHTMVSGLSSYPRVMSWIERCKREMPGYEDANQDGLEQFKAIVESKLT